MKTCEQKHYNTIKYVMNSQKLKQTQFGKPGRTNWGYTILGPREELEIFLWFGRPIYVRNKCMSDWLLRRY